MPLNLRNQMAKNAMSPRKQEQTKVNDIQLYCGYCFYQTGL